MKSIPGSYHYQPEWSLPCPTYHPLTTRELQELRAAFVATSDHYTTMSIKRRIEQGVVGMTAPAPAAGPIAEAARKAVNWFVEWATGSNDDRFIDLQILLGSTQPEMALVAA